MSQKTLIHEQICFPNLFFSFLGWIGFGVPDWHEYQRFNGSITEYYGLWAYCQEQPPFFSTVCKRWPSASELLFNGTTPNFISTTQGLITTGMILLSLGLILGVVALLLPILSYGAGVLTLLGFVFLIIGLPIFAQQSANLSKSRGDARYSRRYGFWLIVPTIILAFIAAVLFFVAAVFYQKFGFGNIASGGGGRRAVGGQRLLGPANFLRGLPYAAAIPGLYSGVAPYASRLPAVPMRQPSLLSQYIAQRVPRTYGPVVVRRTVVTAVSPPSVVPAATYVRPTYVRPTYYRAPVVNLTGQTLVGPLVRRL